MSIVSRIPGDPEVVTRSEGGVKEFDNLRWQDHRSRFPEEDFAQTASNRGVLVYKKKVDHVVDMSYKLLYRTHLGVSPSSVIYHLFLLVTFAIFQYQTNLLHLIK